MDWAEALAALQSSDLASKSDIIAAVKKRVETVIGEKNEVSRKLTETETTVAAIVAGTNAQGESVADKLKDAAAKIAALNADVAAKDASIAKLTTEKAAAESAKLELESKATLASIAAKVGANPAVLATLIPDASKVAIEGEVVKVDGAAWDDWLKTDAVAPFVPALLPSGTNSNKPANALPGLPSGKAEGGEGEVKSIYDAVRRKSWSPGKGA